MRFILSLLLVAAIASCGPNEPPLTESAAADQLTGRWELTEARRDNVKTNLLEGLYFVFSEDGSFETNLLTGQAQTGNYRVDGEEITTTGIEVPLIYEIVLLEDGLLDLRSRHQGFVFQFTLVQATTDAAAPGHREVQ